MFSFTVLKSNSEIILPMNVLTICDLKYFASEKHVTTFKCFLFPA